MEQGNDSRVHQLQQQLLECQRLLTDADARAADCAADARNLKESNDHLTDKLRDEAADRRRADADKLKLAEVVRSLMITNEQLMSRDARTIPSLPRPRDRSGRSHSPHYLTSTFSASEHARLASSRQALLSARPHVHRGIRLNTFSFLFNANSLFSFLFNANSLFSFLFSANSSRRLSSASGRSTSRGRSDAPVELQQIRDGLEDELRLLKRQYNEIASHLSQVFTCAIHSNATRSVIELLFFRLEAAARSKA